MREPHASGASPSAGRLRVAAAVAAVVLVAVACGSDGSTDTDTDTGAGEGATTTTAPGASMGPTTDDHWHSAYGIWVCDEFVPPLDDTQGDRVGIHTHGDGLIHIHPFAEEATGAGATLGLFGEEVALELSDHSFTLPDGDTYSTGDECDGREGVTEVVVWRPDAAPEDGEIVTSDLADLHLDGDRMAYTIAFTSSDTPVEELYPPSVAAVGDPGDLAPGETVLPLDPAPGSD